MAKPLCFMSSCIVHLLVNDSGLDLLGTLQCVCQPYSSTDSYRVSNKHVCKGKGNLKMHAVGITARLDDCIT